MDGAHVVHNAITWNAVQLFGHTVHISHKSLAYPVCQELSISQFLSRHLIKKKKKICHTPNLRHPKYFG